ncbi:phosphoribosylaminoimidazolesuccinocarboxamide synthase [Actinokineospora diospyrosa]|uniref:Phosphoribosylaminoimidazole-succinocarboxamide synthase n=1 Tax=Actinokineospora diospyrosa TaxID=103728 RepID=A0ABT1IKE3_9PSEU|nr:phosphoribosylaminoimidazolesuccinocarboxamide synthase [Actinokineospora diospyrosa]MCP2273122.1 phosphoribosylaminoimidazole-succinocarboxamide synthase [Actinokineospora diospyrosa]
MPTLEDYPKIAAGKVRELHAIDDDHLLLVASDRISAYDFVLESPIPDKGRILTAMSVFWFDLVGDIVPNHLVAWDDPRIPAEVRGRALVVRRLEMLAVEAVARGYLAGSGTKDYNRTGSVCGIALPGGLVEGSKLPEPIYTPATKAPIGEHDENVTFDEIVEVIGAKNSEVVRELTLAVYERAASYAAERGVILADTKFEFGLLDGQVVLGDEVLTPDSSRYWPLETYAPGKPQLSYDKQFVRDWLTSPESGWDQASNTPPPPLPPAVVAATRKRYIQAYEQVTGRKFADWIG